MTTIKWPRVMDYHNVDQPPLIEWIDLGNGTMFRIFAFFSRGGWNRPRDGLVVGIERVGSFFFTIDTFKTWTYISEKLNLPESDARAIADWINVQIDKSCPMQGIYNFDYIRAVEPVMYAGEYARMPLVPDLIDD